MVAALSTAERRPKKVERVSSGTSSAIHRHHPEIAKVREQPAHGKRQQHGLGADDSVSAAGNHQGNRRRHEAEDAVDAGDDDPERFHPAAAGRRSRWTAG